MERHHYSIWIVALFVVASVFIQSILPLWIHYASWLDFPLIVTLYFGLSFREPVRGLSVGLVAGLLQDALSHGPVGMNGLAKTIVGFLASSLSGKIEVDHVMIRALALWGFSGVNLLLLALLERLFFARHFSWANYHFIVSPVLNTVIGFPIFYLGDRFRLKD